MVVISKTGWGFEGYDLWNQMSGGLPLRWYPSTLHKCMMIGMVTWILFIGILEIMKWSGGHLEKKKLKKYKYDGEINGSRIRDRKSADSVLSKHSGTGKIWVLE